MSETFFCVFDLAFHMFILCLFISNTFLYSGTILFFPLFLSLTFPAPFQHYSVILLFHTLLNLKSVKNIVPKYFFSFQDKLYSGLDSSLPLFWKAFGKETNKFLHSSISDCFAYSSLLQQSFLPEKNVGKYSLIPALFIWVIFVFSPQNMSLRVHINGL